MAGNLPFFSFLFFFLYIFLKSFLPFFCNLSPQNLCFRVLDSPPCWVLHCLWGYNPVLVMRLLRFKAAFGACGFSLRVLGANLCAKVEFGDLSGVYGSLGPNSHRCRRKSAAFASSSRSFPLPRPRIYCSNARPVRRPSALQAAMPGEDAGFAVYARATSIYLQDSLPSGVSLHRPAARLGSELRNGCS